MNKLKQLTKAIQKAVPSIMDLKFGCELKDQTSNKSWRFVRMHLGNYVLLSNEKWSAQVFKYNLLDVFSSLEKIEIIGRPISLEDVMITLDKLNIVYNSDGYAIYIFEDNYDEEPNSCDWKPNIPLQDQEQETIEFLWEIICREELTDDWKLND